MSIRKVLVVDDAKPDLANLEKIVSAAGYLVTTATSGAQAIEKAKSERPDAILMDVNMDDTDGFKAARTMQSMPETKGIPVIFVTSKDQKADRVWAQMLGAKALVTKPYTSQQIIEQLQAL
ncbi:MAG: response regulator [Burkholderiales bacterium]